jgi:anti-sigma B factor antagonist
VRVTTRKESALEVTTIVDGNGTALLALTGALDIATTDSLERMVLDALEGCDGVLLDLAGVTVCDSTGLGALVRLHRRAQAAGQALKLTHPRAHVADLLAMTGINKVIPVVG